MANGRGGRRRAGRKPVVQLSSEEFETLAQQQGGLCAPCSQPGSAGGLVMENWGKSLGDTAAVFMQPGSLRAEIGRRYLRWVYSCT